MPEQRRRTWDVVPAIALLVVLTGLAVVGGYAGAFLALASDSCGSTSTCREEQLSAGVLLAALGPAVVTVVAIAAVVERVIRARRAFWPPLVGMGVAGVVWAAGAALVLTGVPS